MEIIRNRALQEKTVVALGNFDGLHRAHTEIINKTCAYAEKHGLLSCVLLFDTHTDKSTRLLTDINEKLEILSGMDIDIVYIHTFDEEFMQKSPDEFAEFLTDALNAEAVCIGYDYRFGHRAQGDAEKLKSLGGVYGFSVMVTDEIRYNNEIIKSTKIRQLIANGEMTEAGDLLGRCYTVTGDVVKGFQNGRKLGTPTANISYADNKLLPKNGVYMGYTTVDGKTYKSVINIGNNPTFGADKVTVESHILDFDGDIYGKRAKVELIRHIRDDKRFNSLDELKAQIEKDKKTAREELECT